MPAVDQCHEQVKHALQKSGWKVEAEHYRIYAFKGRYGHVDMYLSRQTNGSLQQILLVEVKCFPEHSNDTHELYNAIGQYLIYRTILKELNSPYTLYLAIPQHIYAAIFDKIVMRLIKETDMQLVIVDLDTETVTQWIPSSI